MSRPSRDDPPDYDAPDAREIVSGILLQSGDLSRLIEVFYLSLEPGLLETIRWFASLSDDSRRQLGEFIRVAGEQPIRTERRDATTLVITTQKPPP